MPMGCKSIVMGCRKVAISRSVLPRADSVAEPTAAEPSVAMVFRSLNSSEPDVMQALL